MRILLAEDIDINRDVALGQLQRLGYTVDVVGDGNEVLEAIEFINYGVIPMDCQMPKLDGYETTRRIRGREANSDVAPIYIIAITAHANAGDREKCLSAGMDDYLSKPLRPAELRGALERAFTKIGQGTAGTAVPDAETALSPARGAAIDAPVDMERLIELTGGKPEALGTLADRYAREADVMTQSLALAVRTGSTGEIKHWTHKLRGPSGTCGMIAVVPSLRELER